MALENLDVDSLRSLAQFQPFEGRAEHLESVHGELVEAACQTHGGFFTNCEECRLFIKNTWKTELEPAELEAAKKRLESEGRLDQERTALRLSNVARRDLDDRREDWESARSDAVEEWETAVRKEYPLLADADIQTLRDQLRPWLDQVIARHGAEASLLLYPEHPRSRALVDSLAKVKLDFLPDCGPKLNALRPEAFRLMVREPTAAQRAFLGRLLNTGFYLTVLSMDPRASHLVKQETRQTVIYLDTNFLYAVLGVGTGAEAAAAKRLIELCKTLGYSLRVSPWTVDELRTSIAKSKAEVSSMHQSQKAAQVMAEVTGEKGFAPAFWRERRDNNVDAKTFFAKYDQYDRFLDGLGIKVHPQACEAVESDLKGIREYASPLEGLYGVGARPRLVIEHKAKMRLLIEELRGSARPSSFSDVHYWFLTESTMLPAYARMPINERWRPRFPFCILSSSLAQVVRAMVPRTADLNDMIVGLLASPYVGYRIAVHGVHLKAVERVVARIDTLNDVPPAVAVAMVNDEAMAAQVGGETDPTEIDRLVDETLSKKAEELSSRLDNTATEKVRADREREAADERAKESDEGKDKSVARQRRAEEAARAAEAAARAADKRAVLAEKEREEAEHKEAERTREAADTKKNEEDERAARRAAEHRELILRNVLAVVAGLILAGAACALLLTKTVGGTAGIVVTVLGTAAFVYLVLRFASKQLANEAVLLLTAVAAIVAAFAAQS